ncbi:MAG: rod shape-determining protein RodA [Betaproteobacteria bacterium HGW-Betaproteobacteria-16]|nr:MAG: rod shape-determining protein RodA [Betaproteobacteria bacterium HGW-Betaproteobacteria-16]
MAANATPTAPVTLSTSTPTLSSGYKKIASPAAAKLYFVNLRNGMTVTSPVKVIFGLSGMGVAPAGIEKEGTGHHHLLVNVNEVDANAPLPANDQFRHFGAGQTETSVELKPGQHTLQLVLGDQNHIPHHPPVLSERITITVK